MKITFFLVLIFMSWDLFASFMASNRSEIKPDLPTHILIAGTPDKLDELFLYSLITRAKIYQENFPNEQILIIGRSDDKKIIKQAGFVIVDTKLGLLKSNYIKSGIKKLKRISSIDIYAHSNPMSGVTLDSNSWVYPLLNEKDDLWNDVTSKIDDSSFIFIHGCNAGIKFAPELAKKLNIAVFAALTSTDFQKVYNDNFWAFEQEVKKAKASSKNTLSYIFPQSCGMHCTRMKPDNKSYKGHWGDWSAGGYPTFKLFCGSNENTKCATGAVLGVQTFPGQMKYKESIFSLENFKKQLVDFMCPFPHDLEKQNSCAQQLEKSLADNENPYYSPFKGKTLVCDRIKCKAHFNCSALSAAFNSDSCELINDSDEMSSAFTDEYRYLINAYKKAH